MRSPGCAQSPLPPRRSGAGSAAGAACQGTAAWAPPHCLWGRRCWARAGGLCQEDQAASLRGRGISSPPCLSAPEGGEGSLVLPLSAPKASGWCGQRARRASGRRRAGTPQTLTLIVPAVELAVVLCELRQGLLNGLGAGHRQREAALKVLHLVHDQQGPAAGPEGREVRRTAVRTRRQGPVTTGSESGAWSSSSHQAPQPCARGPGLSLLQVRAPSPLPPCEFPRSPCPWGILTV